MSRTQFPTPACLGDSVAASPTPHPPAPRASAHVLSHPATPRNTTPNRTAADTTSPPNRHGPPAPPSADPRSARNPRSTSDDLLSSSCTQGTQCHARRPPADPRGVGLDHHVGSSVDWDRSAGAAPDDVDET